MSIYICPTCGCYAPTGTCGSPSCQQSTLICTLPASLTGVEEISAWRTPKGVRFVLNGSPYIDAFTLAAAFENCQVPGKRSAITAAAMRIVDANA
jgi:hypothetical protein